MSSMLCIFVLGLLGIYLVVMLWSLLKRKRDLIQQHMTIRCVGCTQIITDYEDNELFTGATTHVSTHARNAFIGGV